MKKVVFAALALACAHGTVWAQKAPPPQRNDFQLCDGFPRPTRGTSGLDPIDDPRVGYVTSNTASAQLAIDACDRALADPLLKPAYTIRRASLLQAKAYHQRSKGAFDDALATLTSIDQVGFDAADPLYRRGIGLANRMLRALILIEINRLADALVEIERIERERPYSVSVRNTTMKMRLMIDSGLDNHIALLRELAPIHPGAAFEGFATALNFGRLEDAIRFGSGLAFEIPRNRGSWTVEGDDQFEFRAIEAEAEFEGAFAYALAATGDPEGAARRLLAARERLDAALAPVPPTEPGGLRNRRVLIREREQRVPFVQSAKATLDRWEQLIALRREAPALDLDRLIARLSEFPRGSVPVLADLVANIGGEDETKKAQALRDLLETLQRQRIAEQVLDKREFVSLLPEPEPPSNQVKFRRAAAGIASNHGGFTRREMDGPDDWTIRFDDLRASPSTVEEFGMLTAVTEARDRGYDGILLQSRRLLDRTRTVSSIYGSNMYDEGFESQLRIRLVKRSEMPPELAGSEWRVLDVAKVLADLSDLPTRPET